MQGPSAPRSNTVNPTQPSNSPPTSTAVVPPLEPRAPLSPMERVPPAVLARGIGDLLPYSARCEVAPTSRTMLKGIESDSSDPLIKELYDAKAANDPARLKWAQQALRRRARCEKEFRIDTDKLNGIFASEGERSADQMLLLAVALQLRGEFKDTVRVLDVCMAAFADDIRFLEAKSEVCALVAQTCKEPDDAARWYGLAVEAAKAAAKLDPVFASFHQPVARVLILRKDFHGAREALDNTRPLARWTVMTGLIIEHGLDPSKPVVAPPGLDSWDLIEFYAACGAQKELLKEMDAALAKDERNPAWSDLMNSPLLTSFRETPEGRLRANSLFMLPAQLATIPIRFDWARLPKAAAPGGS